MSLDTNALQNEIVQVFRDKFPGIHHEGVCSFISVPKVIGGMLDVPYDAVLKSPSRSNSTTSW